MKARVRGNPEKLRAAALKRIQAVQRVAGRAIADGVKKQVLRNARLRSAGGQYEPNTEWIKLYREAIRFLEAPDGKGWAIAGVSPTKLTTVPAAATQIKFMIGGGAIIDVVRPYIWTVDTLPAIKGGYKGDVIVRPASENEVSAHREAIRPELPRIIDQLKNAGAVVTDGFPVVQGSTLMDLKFLQLRLEHGLGGFTRSPHWIPAARQAKTKARKWVDGRRGEILSALEHGMVPDADHVLTDSLARLLERVRKTSWT